MKISTSSPRRLFFAASLSIAGLLGLSALNASADFYSFNNGAGGDGVWENGTPTPPAPAASPWSDGGTQNLAWDNTLNNTAYFSGSGGTVDVANDVSANYLQFNAGSDITLNGTGTITVVTGNGILENDTNNNVTINNNIQVDDSSAGDRFDIGDGGANTLTLNGNLSFVGSLNRPAGLDVIFNGGANTVFNMNGSFQGSATTPSRMELSNGTMNLNGDFTNENAGGSLLAVDAGVAYINTNNLGSGEIDLYGGGGQATPELLTVGARDVTNQVTGLNYAFTNPFTSGSIIVGGTTADISTFHSINLVVTGLTLTAAQDGRVNVDSISGNGDITGLVKTGAGTVVLQSASTIQVTNGFNGLTPPYVADIQQGTLLINNPLATSAFGSEGGKVRVRAGATLGGSGAVGNNQLVVVDGPASPGGPTGVIAPGDAGQANLGIHASIATLTLAGGLEADSGLTMDFKLNGEGTVAGVNNDLLTTSSLNLSGPITVNLTAVDTLLTGTGNFYTLIQDNGNWTGDPSSITINAPAGYALDPNFGPDDGLNDGKDLGYVWDPTPGSGSLTVELVATPEPSTWAMLAGGLVLLAVGFRRHAALVG